MWRRVALAVAAATVPARWILARRFQVVVVRGMSMLPTLAHGDVVLGRRTFTAVARDDLVVFVVEPDDYDADVSLGILRRRVKRVIAVEGDRAPSALPRGLRQRHGGVVPTGHVALAGDAAISEGSAQFGYIPIDRIESVVLRRLRRGHFSEAPLTLVADAGATLKLAR